MRDILKNYKLFHINPSKLRSKDFYRNMLEYRNHTMRKFAHTIRTSKPKCPLCESRVSEKFLSYKKYNLYECRDCSLVYPNIEFSKLGNHDVYDDLKYIKDTTREILDTYNYRKRLYAPERLNYIIEKTGLSKKSLNILDVGCGPGYFISHLKDEGVEYKGLELADFLVKICKGKKLNVEKADLSTQGPKSYNVVTMFDVIEHLTDPVSVFKQLNDKLVPGGYVLAYTPNIHSVAYSLMREKQNTLYPFQHLAFFDYKSLNYLAEKTGFKVASIDYFGLDVMDYLCMKLYEDGFDYPKRLTEFISVMQAVIDKQEMSNHMRIFFKKVRNV